jgi:hypothetical protein
MMTSRKLPVPPNRDASRNLCAISAFATATFPFCHVSLNQLLDEIRSYGKTRLGIGGELSSADFYHRHARDMFEKFAKGAGRWVTMFDWLETLQREPAGEGFAGTAANCRHEKFRSDEWTRMKIALMGEDKSVGCVGMRCIEAGDRIDHYVSVWYEHDEFFVLDSGIGGEKTDDGSKNTLEDAMYHCGLAGGRQVEDYWGMVVTAL